MTLFKFFAQINLLNKLNFFPDETFGLDNQFNLSVSDIGGQKSSETLIWYYVLLFLYQTNTREQCTLHRTCTAHCNIQTFGAL